MVKEIQLTKGKVTLVDDEDYDELNKHEWFCSSEGYATRLEKIDDSEKRKWIAIHRIVKPVPIGLCVDHIDGNRLNNQKSNIRFCNKSENACNRPKYGDKKYSSKYKGVTWVPRLRKWKACIELHDVKYYLGVFVSEEEAFAAYKKKRDELHGCFSFKG